jgi:[acyl-carrier-protein] S-malonyltransferase
MCHWAVEAMAGDGLRDQVLEPANFNSPGQVVISGHLRALDWLKLNFSPEAAFATADSIKAKFIPLPVSAPFHCRMMKPAETVMAQVLGEIEFVDASCPIVQNISAEPETKGERLRSALVAQVSGAVRWTESMACILSMAASAENKPASEGQGKTVLVELGAGRVLAGLCKKIAPEAPAVLGLITIDDLKALEAQIV